MFVAFLHSVFLILSKYTKIQLGLHGSYSVKRSDVTWNRFEWELGEKQDYVRPPPPYFIVSAGSVKMKEVKVEFYRIHRSKKNHKIQKVRHREGSPQERSPQNLKVRHSFGSYATNVIGRFATTLECIIK